MNLFRSEAVVHRQQGGLGALVLVRPMTFTWLTVFFCAIAIAIAGAMAFIQLNKKAAVNGFLVPDRGLIRVTSPQTATITRVLVEEGATVKKGTPLVSLSIEKSSTMEGDTQTVISEKLHMRKRSLENDIRMKKALASQQENALRKKISDIDSELRGTSSQLALQRERIQLAERSVQRFRDLVAANFASAAQLQRIEDEFLGQLTALKGLERSRASLVREKNIATSDLAQFPLNEQVQLSEIERQVNSTEQELATSEANRELLLTAQQDGQVSNQLAEVGQSINANATLITLIPQDSLLTAQLYAPSRSVGFIKPGHTVLLRYQAFPFQKFGLQQGTVKTVSRSPILPADLPLPIASSGGEPLYRISVALQAQSIRAYGTLYALQAGMQVEADVVLDKRTLLEWIFEPLFSIAGRL